MIQKCTCKNDYQDSKHGVGNRVKNPLKPATGRPQQVRCTVCLSVSTGNQSVSGK